MAGGTGGTNPYVSVLVRCTKNGRFAFPKKMVIVSPDAGISLEQLSGEVFCTMDAQPVFQTYHARRGKLEEEVRREFASDVIKEFGPIVAPYGFTNPDWVYEKDYEMIEVLFEDPQRRRAVRVDCALQDGSFASNYCREEGEWEICVEGKPKSFTALKKSLRRWIERSCEDCCLDCRTGGEFDEENREVI